MGCKKIVKKEGPIESQKLGVEVGGLLKRGFQELGL
jgi:hypothetical protein